MDDIVARYTLKFNDLASSGMRRVAGAASAMATAGRVASVGIAGLAAGGAILGKVAFDAAGKWASFYDDLGENAAAAGVSAQYLRDMGTALSSLGVEQNVTQSGFSKFNQTLGKIRASGLPKNITALSSELGFLSDSSLTTEKSIDKVIAVIGKMDAQKGAALGAALFGKGAGAVIAAAARDTGALAARIARVRQLGGVVTAKELQSASDYKDAIGDATFAMGIMQNKIGALAAPVILKVVEKFMTYLVANGPQIEKSLGNAFNKIGTAIARVDWAQVGTAVIKLIELLPAIATGFGWVVDNIVALSAAFAGFKILGFLGQFGLLGSLFGFLRTGFSFILPLLPRLAALFGPIGWAISGVVTAGILLYQNWDLVVQKAGELWAFISSAWDSISSKTVGFVSSMGASIARMGALVWAKIKVGIESVRAFFASKVEAIKAGWSTAMTFLQNTASKIWDGIKSYFGSGIASILNDLQNLAAKAASIATFGAVSYNPVGGGYRNPAQRASATTGGIGSVNVNSKIDITGLPSGANATVTSARGRPGKKSTNSPVGRYGRR